jgi:shikimate dehydrogenase
MPEIRLLERTGEFMPAIDAKTTVCAVIGHPIGHSLSPELHNAAFEHKRLPFVYVAHDVEPGAVGRALEGIRAMGYRGLSVTIPHKVEAMQAVDQVDAIAQGIGCINTVVNDAGKLLGYNSDGLGALGALRSAGADPAGKRVVLLGSGGAARAIAITLAMESAPSQMTLLGIDASELDQLAEDVRQLGRCPVTADSLSNDRLGDALAEADVLLHCSPIGMHPKDDATLVPSSLLHPALVVFDVVYNPRRTRLLQDAAAVGCETVEGIEMFLGQAVVQFELWTGQEAPRDVMRQVLEQKL